MEGVIEGFATIGAVIGLGAFLAHIRIVDVVVQENLTRLTFFVASPALMMTVLADADISDVFSYNLLASLFGIIITGTIYISCAKLFWRSGLPKNVIGTLSGVYVNAGNLGIPVTTYVLGDATYIAPTLLIQLLILQPIALTLLDRSEKRDLSLSFWKKISMPFKNPITLGSLMGLLMTLIDYELPTVVDSPLNLVADFAVPAMLLAYGVSLRLGPRPGAGSVRSQVFVTSFLKLIVQPSAVFLIAHFGFHLEGINLLSIVVVAALPTAQNVFIHASRYRVGQSLARDVILITTVASVPVVATIVLLLG